MIVICCSRCACVYMMTGYQRSVPPAELLLDRVDALEQKVFGDLDKDVQYTKAADVLLGFNSRLGNVLGDYDRAVMVMKRIDELEQYLDPMYCHELSASPAQLTAELVTLAPQLKQLAEQLEAVQQLVPLLDSQHIKDAGNLTGRLQQLKRKHAQQLERQTRLTAESQQLQLQYSQLSDTLALSLLQLDERVGGARRS